MRLGFASKVIGMQYDFYKMYRRRPALGGGGRADRQKGVSLFVVLVIVLLSTLLAAWAFRSSIFNQLVVSNDADYQRAFEAAQATGPSHREQAAAGRERPQPCRQAHVDPVAGKQDVAQARQRARVLFSVDRKSVV